MAQSNAENGPQVMLAAATEVMQPSIFREKSRRRGTRTAHQLRLTIFSNLQQRKESVQDSRPPDNRAKPPLDVFGSRELFS